MTGRTIEYFLFWSTPGTFGEEDGQEKFPTMEAVLEFVNAPANVGKEWRLIEGRQINLKAKKVVQEWEADV